MRTEIADAGLDVQLAVRPDRHQAVPTDRSSAVRSDGNADAAHLRPAPLTRVGLAFVPTERFLALVERFHDEGAGQALTLAVRLCRPEDGSADRRVDPADRNLINAELFGRLG